MTWCLRLSLLLFYMLTSLLINTLYCIGWTLVTSLNLLLVFFFSSFWNPSFSWDFLLNLYIGSIPGPSYLSLIYSPRLTAISSEAALACQSIMLWHAVCPPTVNVLHLSVAFVFCSSSCRKRQLNLATLQFYRGSSHDWLLCVGQRRGHNSSPRQQCFFFPSVSI